MGLLKKLFGIGATAAATVAAVRISDKYKENNPDGVGDLNGDGVVDTKDVLLGVKNAAQEVYAEAKETAKEKAPEAYAFAENMANEVKKTAAEVKSEAAEVFQNVKQEVRETVSEVKEEAAEVIADFKGEAQPTVVEAAAEPVAESAAESENI